MLWRPVPRLPVTGTVRSIGALHHAVDEGPNPGEPTVRPSCEVGVQLDAVPGAGTQLAGCSRKHELLAYRVRPEVADDAELPACVLDEEIPGSTSVLRTVATAMAAAPTCASTPRQAITPAVARTSGSCGTVPVFAAEASADSTAPD